MISHIFRNVYTSLCISMVITLKVVTIHHQEFFKLSQNQFMVLGTAIFCISLQNNYKLIFVWSYRNMYVLYSPNHAAGIKDTMNIVCMIAWNNVMLLNVAVKARTLFWSPCKGYLHVCFIYQCLYNYLLYVKGLKNLH